MPSLNKAENYSNRDLVLDRVPGTVRRRLTGRNSDLAQLTPEILWPPGGGLAYFFPLVASQFNISSNSAPDTAFGDGARTIVVHYLDADYIEQTEVVTMNGTNTVQTTGSGLRINRAYVQTVGIYGGMNIGTIDIEHDDSSVVLARMEPLRGRTEQMIFAVPADRSMWVPYVQFSNDRIQTQSPTRYEIYRRDRPDLTAGGSRRSSQLVGAYMVAGSKSFELYEEFDGPCDIWVVTTGSGNTETHGSIWYELYE